MWFRGEHLFSVVVAIEPTTWLQPALEKANKLGFGTGKSSSERLVTSILLELNAMNEHSFFSYSGFNLDVDESLGLRGECDFVFSFSRIQDFVMSPIFCITGSQETRFRGKLHTSSGTTNRC